ncbi:MAG: hypothetical protein HYW98_00955 [Candidatus Wildermuthbacteria bacterium]|nr:hypothetical protein [Candidatus Wildermuthbacteria bacterium]
MELTERQDAILMRAVMEYIHTAEPVSSQALDERYRFDISPATLRNEMKILSDMGFLYQPHTSAGRIPTERGYRFLVDKTHTLARGRQEKRPNIHTLLNRRSVLLEIQDIAELLKELAVLSSNLVVASLPARNLVIKEGWEEVVQEPEFEERGYLIGFTNFLEDIERGMETLQPDRTILVYIGKENPWTRLKEFSVVAASCAFGNGMSGTIAMVGPTRMKYQKTITLMQELLRELS